MVVTWIAFVVECLILYFIHPLLQSDVAYWLLISLNSVLFVSLAMTKRRCYAFPIICAYILRIAVLIFDYNTSILSNMNGDILGYYTAAKEYSNTGFFQNLYGGTYSRLLGVVFEFTGTSRLIGAYMNVLLGVSTIHVVWLVLRRIKISSNVVATILYWIALFPYSIYSSSVVYRETIISFLIVLSFYYAFRWFLKPRLLNVLRCLIAIGIAAIFHAGNIVIAIGYMLLFLFYVPGKNKFLIRRDAVITFGAILAIGLFVFSNPNMFLSKFVNNLDNVISLFNNDTGGSAYLTWINASSIGQVILWSPLKAFYFLFSPVPLDWRGLSDVFTFAIDSFSYIWCVISILKNARKSKYKELIISVSIGIIALVFAFGIGTWTAGTAVRHRNKVFATLLCLFALTKVQSTDCIKDERSGGSIPE